MTTKLVKQLKNENEDYEFYPTTTEMIGVVIQHFKANHNWHKKADIVDIGAGDGRVLDQFSDLPFIKQTYAIEKSQILLDRLNFKHSIMGTDFYETNLTTKEVDVVFCNPPYSDYANWVSTIIRTSLAREMYFIIPERWEDNELIQKSIAFRGAETEVLASDTFLNAERQARAKVDILYVSVDSRQPSPIQLLFREAFGDIGLQIKNEEEKREKEKERLRSLGVALRKNSEEFSLSNLIQEYDLEYQKLNETYYSLAKIDPILFNQLGVNLDLICNSLVNKIKALKHSYWDVLFNAYEPIYRNCTHSTLQKVKDMLPNDLDFTLSNIYAITSLVLRYATQMQKEQLTDWFFKLANPDNIKKYKSNEKVFSKDHWRFRQEKPTHFKLDYRIITDRIRKMDFWGSRELNEDIHDLMVIANTLKLNTISTRKKFTDFENHFEFGKREPIYYLDNDGNEQVLAEVKIYKNGNTHLFLSQEFCIRLNIEVGRLLGWIHSKEEAKEELGFPMEEVEKAFGVTNLTLGYTPHLIGLQLVKD